MKKITLVLLLSASVLLSGCMAIINPLSATVLPTVTGTAVPGEAATNGPSSGIEYGFDIRVYQLDAQDGVHSIKCEFNKPGKYVYRFCDEIPVIHQGNTLVGFEPVPQDNVIKSDRDRGLVVAMLDNDGKVLSYRAVDYIPGVNYYSADSKQYAALLDSVTNTDKNDYSYGYGQLSSDYLSLTGQGEGVNAGINYYCHEDQPFYCPVDGKVINVTQDSVNVYLPALDATLCVMHFSDTSAAQQLMDTDIEAGELLGYTGGRGLTGFTEMHLELLVGKQTNRAGYVNKLDVVRMITMDVRILLDGKQALRDESKPSYLPYNVNAGGNATEGLAARENGYIYFINSADSGRIYRMKADGTEQQKISDKRAKALTVFEGWVYYASRGDSMHFYRSKIDGSKDELIQKTSMSNFLMVGQRVFMENVTKGERLYTLVPGDNQSVMQISPQKVRSPFYYKGVIYSVAVKSNMQVYTTSVQPQADQEGNISFSYDKLASIRATNLVLAEDKIFYANDRKEQKLYYTDLTGEQENLLADVTVSDINYYNGYLYFVNESDGARIYRCRTDGSEFAAAVSDSYCSSLSIAGDWLFYKQNEKTYRYNVITGEIVQVKKVSS